ncbi:MAG: SusC/RagA family TonB-linked outer membrane protein [Bacteroidales bacterium]|nr:SusC/RagA family TonB-linked outer membrane protein [Bacteroidales bacterium]
MTQPAKKFLTGFLCLFVSGIAALAQSQQVTVSMQDVSTETLLREIEAQTGLSVMYNAKALDLTKKVSAKYKAAPVSKVLSEVLGKDLTVSFQGNMAVIYEADKPAPATSQVTKLPAPARHEIKGTVKDLKTGEPMMFVTVSVKGTTSGTMSDTNGRYAITAKDGETILFQILGYDDVEVPVESSTKNVDVAMKESTLELESAVVTALGITRDEKSIGYAVSKVSTEELNSTLTNNWMNGMDGKVAGLTFEQASTGPGGSIRATLRGENSLSHDKNEALFVIDGVPMISNMTASSSGSGYGDTDAPIDYGNGASDLNPEDIESVTVLKGPAATALYGSQAANGAIIITTKTGKNSEKLVRVDFSSSAVFDNAGYWPDFQNEYGAGNGNASTRINQSYFSFWTIPAELSDTGQAVQRRYSRVAYGPKFDGQMFYNYDSANWINDNGAWSIGSYTRTPWQAQDWYKGAFETGYTLSNTVAVSYNPSGKTSIRFSINDKRNSWILPNTGYSSQNFTLSLFQEAGKHVTLGAKVTYYRKDSDNLPTTGYNTASPMYSLMHNTPSIDIRNYADEYYSGRMFYFLRQSKDVDSSVQTRLINYQTDNIYMILNEHLNSLDRDRVFGNANVTVNFTDHLNLMLRAGIDLSTDFRTQRKSTYSYAYKDGYYKEQTVRDFLNTDDLLLTYKNRWGKWDLNATLGASMQVRNYNNVQLTAARLDEPNVFILQNSLDQLLYAASRSNKKMYSVFGTASLSWNDMVYLDITGRNDWSSTLAKGNRSYFYPSVSMGLLLNRIFKMPAWVDILKLRASWANVGNDTDPYNLVFTYSNSTFPSSYVIPNALQNRNLRPENVESWETGVQASFLKKRLSLDLAYYKTVTTDQIISVPSDYITGASSHYINAGNVTNSGVEFSFNAVPIQKKNFRWMMDFNISRNWNKLVELADGVDVWQLNSNTVGSRVFIYAYPGQELGRIYGQGYTRAPKGAYYIDAAGKKVSCEGMKIIDAGSGNPVLNGTTPDDLYDFGSIYPDWKGGFSQTFTFYGVTVDMKFTFQKGGNAYSITHFGLSSQGKLTNTLEGRYEGLLIEGVVDNGDGTYSPNTTIVTDVVDYYTTYKYSRNNVEESVFDTSFLKFKSLNVTYALPKKYLEGVNWLSGVSFGVYATNLFCISNFPIYDPEVATMTGASISRGIEACAYPMTRSYGFNLKLAF